MARDRKNSLFVTATLFVVLMGVGSGYYLLRSSEAPKKLGGIQLAFPADKGADSEFTIDKYENLRNYTCYNLNSDTAQNTATLKEVRLKLNAIKSQEDTINGVHIILSDDTPYNDFIRTITICSEQKPSAFAPYRNDIYAFYLKLVPIENKTERDGGKLTNYK